MDDNGLMLFIHDLFDEAANLWPKLSNDELLGALQERLNIVAEERTIDDDEEE